MPDPRLPAHLEVSALLRQTEIAGGFATVIAKGERESGTLIVVIIGNDRNTRAYDRLPQVDGSRIWQCCKVQDSENKQDFEDYLIRRKRQDDDLWIIELAIADGERLIGLPVPNG